MWHNCIGMKKTSLTELALSPMEYCCSSEDLSISPTTLLAEAERISLQVAELTLANGWFATAAALEAEKKASHRLASLSSILETFARPSKEAAPTNEEVPCSSSRSPLKGIKLATNQEASHMSAALLKAVTAPSYGYQISNITNDAEKAMLPGISSAERPASATCPSQPSVACLMHGQPVPEEGEVSCVHYLRGIIDSHQAVLNLWQQQAAKADKYMAALEEIQSQDMPYAEAIALSILQNVNADNSANVASFLAQSLDHLQSLNCE